LKKTLVWRFDDEVDRMPMHAVRLTVRTVTMRDYGEFQRLSRLGVQLWEQKFPLVEGEAGEGTELVDAAEVTEQPGDKSKQVRPYGAGVYLGIYKRWARLAAGHCAGRGGDRAPAIVRARRRARWTGTPSRIPGRGRPLRWRAWVGTSLTP
jgi:hypothetical protein